MDGGRVGALSGQWCLSGLLGYWVLYEEEERELSQGGSSPPTAWGGGWSHRKGQWGIRVGPVGEAG